jgi:hypothetical protein
MPAFKDLARCAAVQSNLTTSGKPPDTQAGADATIVAYVLFRWITDNVGEAEQREIARQVSQALGLEP